MALPSNSPLQSPVHDRVDDEPIIILDATDIQHGIARCSKSLIGRLLVDHSFSGSTIDTALQSIWRQPEGFKIQFWNLPEHYKSKEIGGKLGSSFGDVIEADLFQVRGLENCIVKAKDEKWGEWLKSDQGGRRFPSSKENSDPNLNHSRDNSQGKQIKPVPVNLTKSLASLSMNSSAESHSRGDNEEVLSKANPNLPITDVPEVNAGIINMTKHSTYQPQDFVFTTSTETTKSTSAKLSIKK
ncbi:hypothetical protein PIB30_018419 [Stylosanthes scabra]|uniref:Uncharacterized protein n=1 Tax=Stylosanthes scabra TaxID=79078 RepID=A0ABU6T957_9FABA|nr:hypothetical protein [Stylosanthes scabra]